MNSIVLLSIGLFCTLQACKSQTINSKQLPEAPFQDLKIERSNSDDTREYPILGLGSLRELQIKMQYGNSEPINGPITQNAVVRLDTVDEQNEQKSYYFTMGGTPPLTYEKLDVVRIKLAKLQLINFPAKAGFMYRICEYPYECRTPILPTSTPNH